MTRHAGGSCRSRGRAEDRSRSAHVRVHAGLGDPEQLGDLLRGQAARDCAQDLALAIGERGDRARAARENAPCDEIAGDNSEDRRSGALHQEVSGAALRAARSARALQRAALVRPDDLVLETLEEQLPATAWAERLVTVGPDGSLTTVNVVVGGAELGNGRPARARGNEHLAQAVTAEIAIKLGSKGHLARNLHPVNGEDRSFVPIPSIGHSGFRIPRYAPEGEGVLVSVGFLNGSLASFDL